MNGTIDPVAIAQIQNTLSDFSRGMATDLDVLVGEGVFFSFDHGPDSLNENQLTVTVGIHKWSPHYNGEPDEDTILIEYGRYSERLAELFDSMFFDWGEDLQTMWSYDKANTEREGILFFKARVTNPRMLSGKVEQVA